jgi:hypothetical protein
MLSPKIRKPMLSIPIAFLVVKGIKKLIIRDITMIYITMRSRYCGRLSSLGKIWEIIGIVFSYW